MNIININNKLFIKLVSYILYTISSVFSTVLGVTTSNNGKKIMNTLNSDRHQEIMTTSNKVLATSKNAMKK